MKYEVLNHGRLANSARAEQEDTAWAGKVADIFLACIIPALVSYFILILYGDYSLRRLAAVFFV